MGKDHDSSGFSFMTTDTLNNGKKLPYTKREILQQEYPPFWGGANELVSILRELQNLLVESFPLYKQILSKSERLDDNNYQNIFLNYIKYRILYAFAEAVWKRTEHHCSVIATEPVKNNSAKEALIHSFEVFDSYPLIDILQDDKNGYEKMNEMIEKYESHFVFYVLSPSWEYHDIIGAINCGFTSSQFEDLWKAAIADPDPKEASIGELLDDNEMVRIY